MSVVTLPGVERRDIGTPTASEAVLSAAIEAGVCDVVVVGRSRTGELYVAASAVNPDLVVGQMMRAVTFLSRAEVDTSE
jgi:hypothetical protein